MRNDRLSLLSNKLIEIVGRSNLITGNKETEPYREGIRVGKGIASSVVLPGSLLQFWDVLRVCISLDKIIIIQAANTGLTGGSTPDGDNYDRDVVIINTLRLDKIIMLNQGQQVLAFPGATLSSLEDDLEIYGREPHSLIGSSCIGASIIGGICNNSGGNLVNRGPAYTELSLFARVNKQGELELVNHLDIELGDSAIEILTNLEKINFQKDNLPNSSYRASDSEYNQRVRDIKSTTPARFNSDSRRLYEASGCAGKIAVFAVRLDTFKRPSKEQVFLVGTNNPSNFTKFRHQILSEFQQLPEMVEYLHKSFFDGADIYGKDTFLIIKYLGKAFVPKLFKLKRKLDAIFASKPLEINNYTDKFLHRHAQLLPDHLPKKAREYRARFDHLLIIKSTDKSITETRSMLSNNKCLNSTFDYYECLPEEGKDLLLHRYVAGIAPKRYTIFNSSHASQLLPLDVALPRNSENWHQIINEEISSKTLEVFKMGHFLCMVFHWDLVLRNGHKFEDQKNLILSKLDQIGAKYPAEHNVGHLYFAEHSLANFYKKIDPTNSFNSGIGQLSKNKFYR